MIGDKLYQLLNKVTAARTIQLQLELTETSFTVLGSIIAQVVYTTYTNTITMWLDCSAMGKNFILQNYDMLSPSYSKCLVVIVFKTGQNCNNFLCKILTIVCVCVQGLVVSKNGTVRSFDGPRRVWVIRKRFILLDRVTASQKEYIRIEERNGTLKNLPGYDSASRAQSKI